MKQHIKIKSVDIYLSVMVKTGLYPNKNNLKVFLNTLFKGIDFENKRVLDIGGGRGLLSLYAACKGAREVICLEPEPDTKIFFRRLQRCPGLGQNS